MSAWLSTILSLSVKQIDCLDLTPTNTFVTIFFAFVKSNCLVDEQTGYLQFIGCKVSKSRQATSENVLFKTHFQLSEKEVI